jgi:nucleoside 2-deoxyribosyltransferase
MKFYVASSRRNIDFVRYVARRLENAGFTLTYDWTENEIVENYDDLRDIGEAEIKAVKEADFLVVLMPAGAGSHVELGVALAQGKRVYLFSADHDVFDIEKTSSFYFVKGVHKYVGFLENFIQEILTYENRLLH